MGPKRTQLPDEVATYVRELILSGQARPGEFLRMEPIAEALSISVTPVREGLLSLSSEGYLDLVPRRGFQVAGFSRQDVRDLFWAQAQLGGELAARAAKLATSADIDLLVGYEQTLQEAMPSGDDAAIAELSYTFHRQINRIADSARLARLLHSIVIQLPNTFYAAIEGRRDSMDTEHTMLIKALSSADSRKARSVMEHHLMDGVDQLISDLEARGLWKAPAADPPTDPH